jgi:acylphosphatase
VQGVGFRATARAIARGYPISGWVRNEADGSVLMEAQGEADHLDGFLNHLHRQLGRFIAAADVYSITTRDEEYVFDVQQ